MCLGTTISTHLGGAKGNEGKRRSKQYNFALHAITTMCTYNVVGALKVPLANSIKKNTQQKGTNQSP
jgi:hypothetical protein